MTETLSPDIEIKDKRAVVLEQIAAAAKIAKRDVASVTLVAVSKVQTDARIQAMLDTGHNVFGENRVQESQMRWGETFKDARASIELRLIGPLQSNKTADACEVFDVIETLDREKLAKSLAKYRDEGHTLPRLLIQVNTGQEPQKAGIAPKDLGDFLNLCRETYQLSIEGLMCIPPLEEAASPHFWLLSNLAKEHALSVISMGMSGDFETAIQLGATHIRVGTALFGERDYD